MLKLLLYLYFRYNQKKSIKPKIKYLLSKVQKDLKKYVTLSSGILNGHQ